jgi:ABC-2 type transport system permease protein
VARYWRIYRTFITSSLARELEFRANFFAKIFQNVVWIGFFTLILLVVYRNTNDIAGWGRGDAFILAATVFVMSAISSAFFFSLTEIPTQVRQGTLDFVVTKPVDSQFWISARRFNFDQIGSLFAGITMIAVGVHLGPGGASLLQWFAYIVLLLSAVAIFYSFNLAMMTTGIWLVRVDNLFILGETVTQVARFPLDIYPLGVQRFLTFAVPLGLLSTIPARQIVRGFDGNMLLWGVFWAALALFLSRRFWRYAMKHYSSASS